MMLNHDERRRLQEIELQLELEDPVLARGMRQTWPRTRVWPLVALVVAGALLALLGLAVLSLYLVVFGVACVVGGIAALRKRRSRENRPLPE